MIQLGSCGKQSSDSAQLLISTNYIHTFVKTTLTKTSRQTTLSRLCNRFTTIRLFGALHRYKGRYACMVPGAAVPKAVHAWRTLGKL